MNRELSKEEVQAQIAQKEQQISNRVKVLEHEAQFVTGMAKQRAQKLWGQAKEQARSKAAIGGAALAGYMLTRAVFGGRSNRPHIIDEGDAYAEPRSGPLHREVHDALYENRDLLGVRHDDHSGGRSWFWPLVMIAGGAYGIKYMMGRGNEHPKKHMDDTTRFTGDAHPQSSLPLETRSDLLNQHYPGTPAAEEQSPARFT
jgi:hypothetical protein